MESSTGDLVLWGVTRSGRTFRPSDWAERLAGLTSAFGLDQKLMYSPLVRPVNVRGVKAVIVGRALEGPLSRANRSATLIKTPPHKRTGRPEGRPAVR